MKGPVGTPQGEANLILAICYAGEMCEHWLQNNFDKIRWAHPEGDLKQQPLLDPNSALIIAEAPKFKSALPSGGNLDRPAFLG